MNDIPKELRAYVETEILPRYDHFDAGHRRDHVQMVIDSSLRLACAYSLNISMAYTIAAYHDTGLVNGRERHHLDSAVIMRSDARLHQWFTSDEIALMCEAVEDHRASAGQEPRSLYGRVVADADHDNTAETIVRRTLQYGLEHWPEMTKEEQRQRTYDHLHEKYAEGGYLHFWLPETGQSPHLGELRRWLREGSIDGVYDWLWEEETK